MMKNETADFRDDFTVRCCEVCEQTMEVHKLSTQLYCSKICRGMAKRERVKQRRIAQDAIAQAGR